MTTASATIFWTSVQVALFSLIGAAVFLIARRRGPSAAATCAATILCAALPLTLLAVSPWPQWSLVVGDAAEPASLPSPSAETTPHPTQRDVVTSSAPAQRIGSGPMAFSSWWEGAMTWVASAGEAVAQRTSPWRDGLLWVLAAGIALAAVRFGWGLIAVWSLRRRSQLLQDDRLTSVVRQTAAEMDAPVVEVRQSPDLRSAATVGGRSPVLLLPADWSSWTETELRVVVAHELAHVVRRDYLAVVIGRLVTSIHFYQPLVLWLNRQLRVQQELAADNRAALVVGSRQSYLRTLAEMALRADEQTIPWAARAFLPGTSLLIKRVTWLKAKTAVNERALSRSARWTLAAAMVAVAMFVAGIRGPGPSLAQAAPPQETAGPPAAGGKVQPLVEFIPADSVLTLAARPAQAFKAFPKSAAPLQEIFAAFERDMGVKVTDLESLALVKGETPNDTYMILRTTGPHDWLRGIRANDAPIESKQLEGKTYYVNTRRRGHSVSGKCSYIPDDRTLVGGTEEGIKSLLAGRRHADAARLAELDKSCVFVWTRMDPIRKQLVDAGPKPDVTQLVMVLGPILQKTSDITVAITMGEGKVNVRGALACLAKEDVSAVQGTLEATRILALNLLAAQREQVQKMIDSGQPEVKQKAEIAFRMFDLMRDGLKEAKTAADGTTVTVQAAVAAPDDAFMAMILPAVHAARDAATRSQSMNNLKQLALAMHNYHAAKGHFPSSANLGRDGKTKHSWRVALLPYLEQQSLYEQYRQEEPWDSEHNKKLIDKMPDLFRDPRDDPKSTSVSYFMPTGQGVLGEGDKGHRVHDVTDGTSHTLMLIEAKREIPWTKPEDIEIDPDKPLPEFGGRYKNIFLAAFADGSVRPIAMELDPTLLRNLLTIDDGQAVDRSQLDVLPKAPLSR